MVPLPRHFVCDRRGSVTGWAVRSGSAGDSGADSCEYSRVSPYSAARRYWDGAVLHAVGVVFDLGILAGVPWDLYGEDGCWVGRSKNKQRKMRQHIRALGSGWSIVHLMTWREEWLGTRISIGS